MCDENKEPSASSWVSPRRRCTIRANKFRRYAARGGVVEDWRPMRSGLRSESPTGMGWEAGSIEASVKSGQPDGINDVWRRGISPRRNLR